MSKRTRRKSRKLSEAEQDEIPSRKREQTLVVSLQNSVIGTRFMLTRLQKRNQSSDSSNKESSLPPSTVPSPPPTVTTPNELEQSFKNPNFTFSFVDKNKKRTWKNLKQIIQSEKSIKMNVSCPLYCEIDAPPTLKPPKKYSDVSGYPSYYTDPLTGLQFNNTEEFEYIRTLPTNIIQGYLGLRGKATIT